MSVTPQQMRSALRRRLAETQEEDDGAARAARVVLPAIVDLLVRDFGARRIVLFGSLARGYFRVDSDIDLAVEGIPASRFMTALARASELAGRRVDLVDLGWTGESLKATIERQGQTLYVAG